MLLYAFHKYIQRCGLYMLQYTDIIFLDNNVNHISVANFFKYNLHDKTIATYSIVYIRVTYICNVGEAFTNSSLTELLSPDVIMIS